MADVPPADPGTLKPWLAAVFISAIVALSGVVAYLFRLQMRRETRERKERQAVDTARATELKDAALERAKHQEQIALERAAHEKKVVELRAEYELKFKELTQQHAKDLRQLYEDNRIHEDQARKEFAEIMDSVAAKAGESSQAIVAMLDKFYDRFVGPRARI